MLKSIVVSVMIFMALQGAGANELPKCEINGLNDAESCVNKLALALPEYELPNDGMISADKTPLKRAFKAMDTSEESMELLERADFVGAVLLHGDEHEIVYYAFMKGQGFKEIYSLNVVDISYMLKTKVDPNDFFLGLDGKDCCAFEDILYQLKEFENNN